MRYFRDMPITNKIMTVGLLPGMLALILVNIGFFSGMYEIEQDASSVDRLNSDIFKNFNELVFILEHENTEQTADLNNNFENIADNTGISLHKYEKLLGSAESADIKIFHVMKDILNKIINLHVEIQSSNNDRLYYINKIEAVEREIYSWFISAKSIISSENARELTHLTNVIISVSILSFLFALFLSLRFSHYVKKPIKALSDCSQRFGSGYLDERVQIDSNDELGRLGQTFNKMAADLKESIAAQDKEKREHIKTAEEKTKLLELVEHAQRLESIGTLAGGIAHDFNNILTAIMGNLSLARMLIKSGASEEELNNRLEASEQATRRAKDLTSQLLTFSKGGEPIKAITSLNELIRESCKFVLHGSNVRSDFFIADNLSLVEADAGQINQVLNNLVINAAHSMPDGGIVNVYAENLHINSGSELPLPDGNYVLIKIEDHGIGIPSKHLKRIFDPYFTTKPEGHGLGLATAYSIIRRHDGLLTVDSKLGEGSTFSIYLPVAKQTENIQAQADKHVHIGKGSILLMDDQEDVRRIGRDILNYLGYEVETAQDGEEAIELYSKAMAANGRFDVVILDITVPGGMGGEETFQRLRQLDPSVKVIVSSGYSQDPIMANYGQFGFAGVIPKPYIVEDVSRLLSDIIQKN